MPLTRACEQRARETVRALKLYAYSLDTYGKTPFIYPMYGLGGLPEGFSRYVRSWSWEPSPQLHPAPGCCCRLCAIKGGTFMLNTRVDEVLFDEAGHAAGVRSGDQAATAKFVIGEPTYFPESKVKRTGKV